MECEKPKSIADGDESSDGILVITLLNCDLLQVICSADT